ncbi:MAG: molybdopterin-dependent oxidoreductase [Nitrospirae bacterium]|nr:molybdopterin-dependent oxidoreductase [Nitrospirota bacterium]
MLINLDKCVGCFACQVTCKAEYDIPFGTFRCKVETYRSGGYPDIKKFFLPRLCNHCATAPCIEACEEQALYRNHDGVVLLDNSKCTGCQMCYDKCPYNAIGVNQFSGAAEKCDFCYERRAIKGLSPVCVQSCMGKAMVFGDINDKKSDISIALENKNILAIAPELATNPSVFYTYTGPTENSQLKDYRIAGVQPARRTPVKKQNTDIYKDSQLIYTSDAMCPSECGISVLVENGIAKKIYGNPHSLINNGAFCAKGASGLQLTYSPHRIKTPLMRSGERGEDKWKEITWEEAANFIAKKLIDIKQKYGPESVFLDCGDVTDREAYYRLFHAFGSPNTYNHGSICDPNRKWGQGIMMGDERPLPDIQRPVLLRNDDGELYLHEKHDIKLLLNIGANPFVATRFNYMSRGIPAAREENGCIYIVIDPAYTNSAAHADMWLPIKPGADAALLAAMLFHIINNDSGDNKYIDHTFIEKYTAGWQKFKDTFLEYTKKTDPSGNFNYFTLEWAEEKTGLLADDIRKISHLFGITKPAAMEIGMHGTSHHTNGDVTSILMTALCLITGNVDIPGGLVFIDSQKPKKGNKTIGKDFLDKVVSREISGRQVTGKLSELNKDTFGDYPASWKGVLTDLPVKIKKGVRLKSGPFKDYAYPVKAFVTRAGNPVMTAGNTPEWRDALTAKDDNDYLLDLMVFIDTHITDTGKYADIVLPEAGYLERMGVSDVYTMIPEIAIRDQVIKPLHGSKTPYEFMITLAEALIKNGDPDIRAEDFRLKYNDEEAFINEILSEAPGFFNIGEPLPYPGLPEGCLIRGVPDNPEAAWGDKIIKHGEPVTADWLRKHNGVAVWPASYYRYKNSNAAPSGKYPRTASKKFEFKFSYIENINRTFGTDLPTTFYWSECKWNSQNSIYKNLDREYPFQLISGRVHHSMTMTTVCPYLSETNTECMEALNDQFRYTMPGPAGVPNKSGLQDNTEIFFKPCSVSIPVLAVNRADGESLSLKTGDIVTLENPLKKRIRGKVFLTDEIRPGVIKTAFGPGGQKASGTGFMNHTSEYTPNINELHDPENITSLTGAPGFGDIMVKLIKETAL